MRTFPTWRSTPEINFFQTQAAENTQDSRTKQSAMLNNAWGLVSSDSIRILQRTSDLSSSAAYKDAGEDVQEPVVTQYTALESVNEGPLSLPAQKPVAVPAPKRFKSNFHALPQASNIMHQVARGKAVRWHVSQVDRFLSQATEETLPDAF